MKCIRVCTIIISPGAGCLKADQCLLFTFYLFKWLLLLIILTLHFLIGQGQKFEGPKTEKKNDDVENWIKLLTTWSCVKMFWLANKVFFDNWDILLHFLQEHGGSSPQGILGGIILSVSKKLAQQQTELFTLASSLGADYRWLYDESCTHLIHQVRDSTTIWLEDCYVFVLKKFYIYM